MSATTDTTAPATTNFDSKADSESTSHLEDINPHRTLQDVHKDDPHKEALEDNPEKAERLSAASAIAVFFLCLSFVAPVGVGFLLVTAIIFQIGTELGDVSTIVWIPGGWTIASSVSFSIAGSLSDIFGRRYVILVGQAFVLVGGIIGSRAQATTTVIAASTIVGFGCGFVFVAYAGIPELLPNKYRGLGIGFSELCLTMPWASFSVLLGNLLYINASWRWVYYITIIYAGVCSIGCAIFYYPPSRPRKDYSKSRWQETKELDYIGTILYTGGLTTFLIGITWAGSSGHAWDSVSVVAPLVIGIVVFISCFAYDFTLAKEPIFPLPLFKQIREFTVLLVVLIVSGMVFHAMAPLLPQMTRAMFTTDGVQVGWTQLPGGLGGFTGGFVIPALMHKIKHVKTQIIVGLVIQTLFVGLYAAVIPNNKAAWMAFQFFGQGCFTWITTLAYVISSLHVSQSQLGLAAGLLGTFRSGGGAVGNAIFTTILNTVLGEQLVPRIIRAGLENGFPVEQVSELVPAVMGTANGVPGLFANLPAATSAVQSATSAAYKAAYAYAFRRVAYATIPFGVIAIVAACFIKDPSMYLTNHVAIHMEKNILAKKQDEPEKA